MGFGRWGMATYWLIVGYNTARQLAWRVVRGSEIQPDKRR